MIAQLSDKQQERGRTPTDDDREAKVAVFNSDTEEWTNYTGDDIAEVITLPGGMVQAIDLDGERHDPIPGDIIGVTGDLWSVWTKDTSETNRHDEQTHVQQNPNGTVVLVDGTPRHVGHSIRRAKRTSILDSNGN